MNWFSLDYDEVRRGSDKNHKTHMKYFIKRNRHCGSELDDLVEKIFVLLYDDIIDELDSAKRDVLVYYDIFIEGDCIVICEEF